MPESSWNCPSIELMRVFRVETDPSDCSSDIVFGCLEWVMECGMEGGYRLGDGDVP